MLSTDLDYRVQQYLDALHRQAALRDQRCTAQEENALAREVLDARLLLEAARQTARMTR